MLSRGWPAEILHSRQGQSSTSAAASASHGSDITSGIDISVGVAHQSSLLAWLDEVIDLHPSKTVLEIGIGTGRYMPLLVKTGARVIAVELTDEARLAVAADFGVEVLAGNLDPIGLPSASVDVVFCAQPIFWHAKTSARAEVRRVLKPHGILAQVWNVLDFDSDDVEGSRLRKRRASAKRKHDRQGANWGAAIDDLPKKASVTSV